MASLPGGTVTFLFTDIEGSTRLLQELGDDYGESSASIAGCCASTWAQRAARKSTCRQTRSSYAENVRSIAVARKLGMELDGEVEIFGRRVSVYALGKRPAR
jgi:hypothetical protein